MDARIVASRRRAGAVTKGDGQNAGGAMTWPMKRDRSRRAAFASLWLFSLACPARAADLPVKAPALQAVYDWTGFYVGGHFGYGQGSLGPDSLQLP